MVLTNNHQMVTRLYLRVARDDRLRPHLSGDLRKFTTLKPNFAIFFFFQSDSHFVNLLRSPGIDSQPGGIDCLESIPMLLKCIEIWALVMNYWSQSDAMKVSTRNEFFQEMYVQKYFRSPYIHLKTERKKSIDHFWNILMLVQKTLLIQSTYSNVQSIAYSIWQSYEQAAV